MPSAWITHAKKVFEDMKKKDPKAKYSDALKKATTTYKKSKRSASEEREMKMKKN